MAKTKKELLEELLADYEGGGYRPKTDEEIEAQARGEYQSYYDQLRLNAQQSFDRNDLALQQQKEALDYAFQKQHEAAEKEYNQAYSQADRQMLSRGMQRSSYGAQTLANIRQQLSDVHVDLDSQQAAQGNNLEAQRVQLAQQLSDQLGQYDAGQAADELKRIQELKDQEYERALQGDALKQELALQLYGMLPSGGGGSGGGSNTTAPPAEETPSTPTGASWEDFMNSMGGSGLIGNTILAGSNLLAGQPSFKIKDDNQNGGTKLLQGPIDEGWLNYWNNDLSGTPGLTGKPLPRLESELLNQLKKK